MAGLTWFTEESRMELSADERKALVVLLRCRELERDSKLVSKMKEGTYPCERLLQEVGDADRLKLEFIPGPEEELREFLAKLAVYAKVLSDLHGLNLAEPLESAAEKIREEGLVPQLVFEGTPNSRGEAAVPETRPVVEVDKVLEQLRQALWQPVWSATAELLKDAHPVLFADPEVTEVVDRLIDSNLKEEFEERHVLVEESTSRPEGLNFEELREEAEYLLRESMKYWVEHWAIEEIAQELKAERKKEPARK
mgnify:CR=1 FL=1